MPIAKIILENIRAKDPKLTMLSLRYQNLSINDIKELTPALASNPHLVDLDLTGNLLGDACIELIVKCPFLRSLNLSGNCIGDKELFHFARNDTLISLNLSHNQINDEGIKHLAENKTLTTLILNGNRIVKADKLAMHPKLVTLFLMNNEINMDCVENFIYNTTLRRLFLDDNLLGDAGAHIIAKNLSLEELSLSRNNITDRGTAAFGQSSNTRLHTLYLNYNIIGDLGAATFKDSKNIKNLCLAGNRINCSGMSALRHNTILVSLDLSYNQVDDHALTELSKNTTLTHLNLSYNQINSEGISYLMKMPKLSFLSLNYNNVGDHGTTLLAESKTLTYLNLTGNNIGFEGAASLADNTSITTLILTGNNLGDPGAMLLAHNKTLRTLSLSYNSIGNAGAMAYSKNQTLTNLNLNYNHIDQRCKEILEKKININNLRLSLDPAPGGTTDKLQLIFTFTQNLFCILGFDGKIHFCNPAFVRLLGYQDDELLGKHLFDLLHPEDRINNNPLAKINQKFPSINLDNRFLCKDDSYRIIRWNSQLRNNYIFSACTDISDQKKSEREYLRLQKKQNLVRQEEAEIFSRQQSQFIANLSHEIRNPLSAALGSADLMEESINEIRTACDKGEIQKVIAELSVIASNTINFKKSLEYAENILNTNLDLVKICEKTLTLENKPINVQNVVMEAIKIIQPKAKQKNLSISIQKLQHELWMAGDAARIQQVIINLINNAIKFTDQGEIKVVLSVPKSTESSIEFKVDIIDTGIGMSEEEMSHLFNRHFQAGTTISSQYGGAGLGLHISKKIANLMGGIITVQSQKGKGSMFSFIFPSVPLMKQPMKQPTPELPPPTIHFRYEQQNKLKVLIVEDNDINRAILNKMLEKDFVCIEAKNGQEAVEIFKTKSIDVILMDVIMPVMNGIEATRAIRAIETEKQLSRVPIFAITANVLEKDRNIILEAGADNFFSKPYKKEDIINAIHTIVKSLKESKGVKPTLKL